jgi:hypothetical protein
VSVWFVGPKYRTRGLMDVAWRPVEDSLATRLLAEADRGAAKEYCEDAAALLFYS